MLSISFITDQLATGGQITLHSQVEKLLQAGITHVLNLSMEEDQDRLFKLFLAGSPVGTSGPTGIKKDHENGYLLDLPEFKYLWNPTKDDGQPKPTSWFKVSLDFALPALKDPGSRVFAHCKAGFNRGPSTCYCILRAGGWSRWKSKLAVWMHRPITIFGGMRYAADADRALLDLGYPP